MRPIQIHYLGGPYDGAVQHLDLDMLPLEDCQPFELPHLTKAFLHTYRCDFWQDSNAMPVVEVQHAGVRQLPEPADLD